jgi:hypothetical protein
MISCTKYVKVVIGVVIIHLTLSGAFFVTK